MNVADPRMGQKYSCDTLSRLVTSSSLLPKNNFVTRTCLTILRLLLNQHRKSSALELVERAPYRIQHGIYLSSRKIFINQARDAFRVTVHRVGQARRGRSMIEAASEPRRSILESPRHPDRESLPCFMFDFEARSTSRL